MSTTNNPDPLRDPTQLPPWLSTFESIDVALRFVAVLDDMLCDRWGGDVTLDPWNGSANLPNDAQVNFFNLARDASASDESEWRNNLYLTLSMWEDVSPERIHEQICCWDRVKDVLRFRIYDGDVGWPLVDRAIARGARFSLAADLPIGASPISAEDAANWGVSIDEAWAVAHANTAKADLPNPAMVRTHDSTFLMLEGDLFTTAMAHDLSPLEPLFQEGYGALVSAPTSKALLVHLIKEGDHEVRLDVATRFAINTADHHAMFPHSLSTQLFWYRGVGDLVGIDQWLNSH